MHHESRIVHNKMNESKYERTLRAATAAANRSSLAFSFCLRFLRRVSGTSTSCTAVRTCESQQEYGIKLTETVGTLEGRKDVSSKASWRQRNMLWQVRT